LVIKNMHPDGEINTILPQVAMLCELSLNGQLHKAPFKMETLILEPNQKQISMVWKSAFECDKQALKISQIEIKLTR
ncbi:MAG: DUF2169 domain-containing protein, partial [Kangiellaceae bacterium]|nr:DUF2169 domain-containing protein [Kangiellaceae bacterium]